MMVSKKLGYQNHPDLQKQVKGKNKSKPGWKSIQDSLLHSCSVICNWTSTSPPIILAKDNVYSLVNQKVPKWGNLENSSWQSTLLKTDQTDILHSYYETQVQFSYSVVSNSLRPHEPQHTRPPYPSPTTGVYPNPCPLSQ